MDINELVPEVLLKEQIARIDAEAAEFERAFLEHANPTEFVLWAVNKKRIPIGSTVVFPPGGEWGPPQQ